MATSISLNGAKNTINSVLKLTSSHIDQSSVLLIKEKPEIKSFPTAVDLELQKQYDDVRVFPSYIEFTDAAEGITCSRNIVIQNCGTKPAFIKIREPNSISFQVKPLKTGKLLSPGLSMTTSVTYTFRRPAVLRAIIPIEINNKTLDYCVVSTLQSGRITVQPNLIDFGIIDVGYISTAKFITISNEGGKSSRFSVDLSKNDLDITVRPMRGLVRPHKTITLKIEIIGVKEGMFVSEFWIKSTPNIRVPLRVNVIKHRLLIFHPNTTGEFALIDFPPTVVNTSKYNTFALRNISSRACNYIVLGEVDNELKSIRNIDCRKNPVYEVFEINPIEGYVGPFGGIIFKVGFHPTMKSFKSREILYKKQETKFQTMTNKENDFMAFIRIIKVHCTDAMNIPGCDYSTETGADDFVSDKIHMQETLLDLSSSSSYSSSTFQPDDQNSVRLCLYGEMEVVKLNLQPDTLYFDDLYIGETSQRVLRIKNMSNIQTVTFQCVPMAAVRYFPKCATLKPNGSTEVLVKIEARENVESTFMISIDAIVESEDPSLTKKLNKIKVNTFHMKCAVNIFLKRRRPMCRPCAGLGFKIDCDAFDFHRTKPSTPIPLKQKILKRAWPKKIFVDEDIDIISRIIRIPNQCKKLPRILPCDELIDIKPTISEINAEILTPLSPLQIYNVHVYPATIDFGQVALRTPNYQQLIVENRNEFSIQIQLLSIIRNLRFPDGDSMILHPEESMIKIIEFYGNTLGKFNGFLTYNINGNHSFDLGIVAEIVHKDLSIDKREIILGKDYLEDESYRPMWSIVQIKNKLDAATRFKWNMPASTCFYIEPRYGIVRGNSTLNAFVFYDPDPSKVPFAEMTIKCESGTYSTLRCSLSPAVLKVAFVNDQTDLGELSLNLPCKTYGILQNSEFTEVIYEVETSSLVHGCEINPLKGRIPPRGIVILETSFKFDMCVNFLVIITVIVQKHLRLQWKVKGSVPFPKLKFTPQAIEQRRVIVDTSQSYLITAMNIGTTTSKLRFVLDDYPEISVFIIPNKKSNNVVEDETSVIIPAGSSQNFYLYFRPLDPANYVFYLPIVINDLLGPVTETDPKTLKPREYFLVQKEFYKDAPGITFIELPPKLPLISIDFTVAGHILVFNKFEFNFNIITNDVQQVLKIQNLETVQGVSLILDINNFLEDDCPFCIRWSHGTKPAMTTTSIIFTLLRGEEISFILEFEPTCPGIFNLEAPIFIQREKEEVPFNTIYLHGIHPEKTLETDRAEIYLLPVPLNTPIEETFKLKAQYFENPANILWRLSIPDRCCGNFNKDSLNISFLNGNVVPRDSCTELDVMITFKSETTVSFCSKIEFYIEDDQSMCSVTVYAAADNHLLTIHAYLRTSNTFQSTCHENAASADGMNDKCSAGGHSDPTPYNYTDKQMKRISTAKSLVELRHEEFIDDRVKSSAAKSLVSNQTTKKLDNERSFEDLGDSESGQDEETSRRKSLVSEEMSSLFEDSYDNRRYSSKIMYPYFPSEDEITSDYEQHMHEVLLSAEQWLYANVFKYSFYPNICDGITASLSIVDQTNSTGRRKNSNGNKRFGRSFIDALESLVGPTIYDHVEKLSSLPRDNVQRIDSVLRQYEGALDFLLEQGACLAHVSAYFLLSYDDYVVFVDPTLFASRKKKLESHHFVKLSKKLFESRSKQCWLDLILQTYKCFKFRAINQDEYKRKLTILSTASSRRSTTNRESTLSTASFRRMTDFYDNSIEGVTNLMQERMKGSDFAAGEVLLLAWLHYHYEEQRTKDWFTDQKFSIFIKKKDNFPPPKNIDNFTDALRDGLALIAVTAVYCPFLIDECFSNLYVNPASAEEELHNATCCVMAWKNLRLGFIVTPSDIARPNYVTMLMLVTHLFEILPSYVPKFKIKFNCSLTQTVIKQVHFANMMDHPVEYLLFFIDNDNGFFSLSQAQHRVRINAHDTVQVKICFHAKKIRKIKAFLLLCGYAYGPHFGNNQTYALEGNVTHLEVSQECVIRSKLYQILDTTLSINIPYQNAAEYEIWMTEEQPGKLANLKMSKWSKLRTRKTPRRLFLNQKVIVVDENVTEANLSVTVACIVPTPKKFWLICQSKIGDFIIQIVSRCQTSLLDRIIVKWSKEYEECTCTEVQGSDENCPYNIQINIPCRNSKLWNCVNHMFQKTLDSKERLFWSRYLDTYIGLRLIHWLMGYNADSSALEFMHIFNAKVTYSVSMVEKNSLISLPETFNVNDVRLENECVPMTIHLCPAIPDIYEATLSLTSKDGNELRLYAISFLQTRSTFAKEDSQLSLDDYEDEETGSGPK